MLASAFDLLSDIQQSIGAMAAAAQQGRRRGRRRAAGSVNVFDVNIRVAPTMVEFTV